MFSPEARWTSTAGFATVFWPEGEAIWEISDTVQGMVVMKYATLLGTFVVMLTLVPGSVSAEDVVDDSTMSDVLFVLSAHSGSLNGDAFILNGAPNVIYFSNRPARKAGHVSVSALIEMWDDGVVDSFGEDPPNATLSVLKKDGAQNVVITLLSAEQKNGSLHFQVAVLEGNLTGAFGISSLFIDCPPGCPSGP